MASTNNVSPSAEHMPTAPCFSHNVVFDRLKINFVTDSKLFYEWLKSYYQTADHQIADEEYTIHLEEIGSGREHSIQPPESSSFAKFCLIADAHCFYGSGRFYSAAEGEQAHTIELDVRSRQVRANLGGVFLKSEESFIYVVVRDILRRLVLPLSGLLMLHGSVVTKENQTIFFAGNKAMGKSTIALEMMRHGYKIMSDDSPLAAFTMRGAQVMSGFDQLSVTENTLSLFPELNEFLSKQRDVSGKFFLDRTRMGPDRIEAQPSRITHFVELKRDTNSQLALRSSEKSLATANFVREFMPLFRKDLMLDGSSLFFKQANATMFQILSSLLSSAATYELAYSNEHRQQIPEMLKALQFPNQLRT